MTDHMSRVIDKWAPVLGYTNSKPTGECLHCERESGRNHHGECVGCGSTRVKQQVESKYQPQSDGESLL
jgi:ribosomal protein L37E